MSEKKQKLYWAKRTGHPCCGMEEGKVYPVSIGPIYTKDPVYFDPIVNGEHQGGHHKGFELLKELSPDEAQTYNHSSDPQRVEKR